VHGFEIEGAARSIRETAGFALFDAPSALELAHGLGLRVLRAGWLRSEDSAAIHPSATGIPTAIALRHGLSPLRSAWCIAHEVAEIDLVTVGYRGEDVEAVAEALAAALLMPQRLFRLAVAELGADVQELAQAFAVPETAAALRLAEVGAVDAAAVVTPRRVHVRSSDSFVLPAELELRAIARGGHPGLRKVRLLDDPRRVALLAGG
jgi:hypothetical protein